MISYEQGSPGAAGGRGVGMCGKMGIVRGLLPLVWFWSLFGLKNMFCVPFSPQQFEEYPTLRQEMIWLRSVCVTNCTRSVHCTQIPIIQSW